MEELEESLVVFLNRGWRGVVFEEVGGGPNEGGLK